MASIKLFLKSGHPPTLIAAFLYFDFSFAVWVLNGAMGPFISEAFHLRPAQIGLMVSVPTLAGAFMRFPLGVLSQYIGRKNAAIVEMSAIVIALLYGFFFVHTFNDVLAMGVLLGIAGASFGVALSLGSGWFPRQYKGLAMGIAGAGNSGTALAALFAPRLAMHFGWQHVYGFAAAMMLLPLLRHDIFRQGAAGYRAPVPRGSTSIASSKKTAGTSTWSTSSPLAASSASPLSCLRSTTPVPHDEGQAGELTVLATLTGVRDPRVRRLV